MAMVTGWKSPTTTHASSSFSNANNGWTSNDSYTTLSYISGSGNVDYDGFTFGIPSNAVILGVEVKVEHKESADSDNWNPDAYVSANHGGAWSAKIDIPEPTTADREDIVGSATNLWGRTWNVAAFDANFVVRIDITDSPALNAGSYSLDAVSVQVSYALLLTFTADGIVKETKTKTFTADGYINVHWLPFTADAIIATRRTKTFTTHGIIASRLPKTFTADGLVVDDKYYTYSGESTLPTDNASLDNAFTPTDYTNVATEDSNVVDLAVKGQNGVYLFRAENDNTTEDINITIKCQSTIACTEKTIYLQIYNFNSAEWEALDSDNSTGASTLLTLSGSITSNQANYYDTNKRVFARIYQEFL